MFRKVAGVLLLSAGGIPLMSSLLMSSMVLEIGGRAMIVLPIFAGVGMGLMVAGTALWGWSRWRMVLGIAFTAVGGVLASVAITVPFAMISPEWKMAGGPNASAAMKPMIASSALFGAILLAVGIPLIIRQRKRDREAAV